MDVISQRAGAVVGAIRRRGRRLDTYSLELGGGLRANVVQGRLVGFGLEPVGVVVHQRHLRLGDGRLGHGRRAIAWAAPIAGTVAAAGAAVATGLVIRHRRFA
jgi:hypothetical protein